ncbi:MAG: FMN-binding protein [Alistipes shahii]
MTKDGGDVDALTAATISSRAYVDAINRAWMAYQRAWRRAKPRPTRRPERRPPPDANQRACGSGRRSK